jgi:hypothetical protein
MANIVKSPGREECQFDGVPDIEVERWLGDRFESWVPSRRLLLVRMGTGEPMPIIPGQWMAREDGGAFIALIPAGLDWMAYCDWAESHLHPRDDGDEPS